MDWEVIDTKIKTKPTILLKKENKRYYLHSKYDPIKEAKTLVDHFSIDTTFQDIIVIGVGLGYHVSLLAEKYPHKLIHVFEFNYLFMKWLLRNKMIINLITQENITFYYEKDLTVLLQFLSGQINEIGDNLLIYKPSLELIESDDIRLTLESFILRKRTITEQIDLLRENFVCNLKLSDKDVSKHIGLFHNSSSILVSAGPSLTKQIPLLKLASEKGVIIACVGTALLPLAKAGIKPNLIMISDPKDLIIEQFLGLEKMDIPLFYISTANHNAVKRYEGPRYIVWQKGFKDAEKQAEQHKVPLIETGGSVATCLLDLLIKMGIKDIALVGQDLAYTNNKTHAIGSHLFRENINLNKLIEVDDYYQSGKIKTSRNLYTYLKWFEQYAEKHRGNHFINCTEGGAHLKGWEHRPLSDFLENMQISNGGADF